VIPFSRDAALPLRVDSSQMGYAMPVKPIDTVALPLLAALAVGTPSGAGPPERPSGRMSFDVVADGLRRYARETDDSKRIAWLEKLAPARDPRVALLIGEYPPDDIAPNQFIGLRRQLLRYYVSPGERLDGWWRANEADLRHRAKRLRSSRHFGPLGPTPSEGCLLGERPDKGKEVGRCHGAANSGVAALPRECGRCLTLASTRVQPQSRGCADAVAWPLVGGCGPPCLRC
jgi:hypothetical protein